MTNEGRNIERRIARALWARLDATEFAVVAVDDGGEMVKPKDGKRFKREELIDATFAVDDCRWIVQNTDAARGHNRPHAVLLIGGNGVDYLSDWSYSEGDPDGFNAVLDAFLDDTVARIDLEVNG